MRELDGLISGPQPQYQDFFLLFVRAFAVGMLRDFQQIKQNASR